MRKKIGKKITSKDFLQLDKLIIPGTILIHHGDRGDYVSVVLKFKASGIYRRKTKNIPYFEWAAFSFKRLQYCFVAIYEDTINSWAYITK